MSDRMREGRHWVRKLEDLEREEPAPASVQEEEAPLAIVIDRGPLRNSRRTERAIQRQEDRITWLDERDRW